MAARRGKSQARRNSGTGGGLPGWAWMVLGVVLTIGVILAAPRFLQSGDGDGFFRPKPNPDAQPAESARSDEDEGVADGDADAPKPRTANAAKDDGEDYDFYTLLPGEEVAMTDAQLAAAARAEQARQRQVQAQADTSPATPAAAGSQGSTPANGVSQPVPLPDTGTTPAAPAASNVTASTAPAPGNDTPYILQAGAFGGSGDAEAVKAKIALLGLNARVESAEINGKTVYRVRMGPYGTASELAVAKGKLAGGGLPALAIKAK